jgi:hypothetical protein
MKPIQRTIDAPPETGDDDNGGAEFQPFSTPCAKPRQIRRLAFGLT